MCCAVLCCVFYCAVLCCVTGLGVLSGLSDDVILGLLELLPAADLARLGLASKAMYCFVHTTDLWKALVLQVGGRAAVVLRHIQGRGHAPKTRKNSTQNKKEL
jgi:hypothetical protein